MTSIPHGLTLLVRPGVVFQATDFSIKHEPHTLALDGYVKGITWLDPTGPYANFNHHEGCDRMATRATCAITQTYLAMGLLKLFRNDMGPRVIAAVNDCDEDVCLSVFLLSLAMKSPDAVFAPLMNALVRITDLLDMSAGAWPINPDMEMMRKIMWAYRPYRHARTEGRLSGMTANDMTGVIEQVGARLTRFMMGNAELAEFDGRYDRLGGQAGIWTLTKEHGPDARLQMFADGIDAFIAIIGSNGTDRWRYVGGRRSELIPFPCPQIVCNLNNAETQAGGTPSWGGSTTVFGSPRDTDSLLNPDRVTEVVTRTINSIF